MCPAECERAAVSHLGEPSDGWWMSDGLLDVGDPAPPRVDGRRAVAVESEDLWIDSGRCLLLTIVRDGCSRPQFCDERRQAIHLCGNAGCPLTHSRGVFPWQVAGSPSGPSHELPLRTRVESSAYRTAWSAEVLGVPSDRPRTEAAGEIRRFRWCCRAVVRNDVLRPQRPVPARMECRPGGRVERPVVARWPRIASVRRVEFTMGPDQRGWSDVRGLLGHNDDMRCCSRRPRTSCAEWGAFVADGGLLPGRAGSRPVAARFCWG